MDTEITTDFVPLLNHNKHIMLSLAVINALNTY